MTALGASAGSGVDALSMVLALFILGDFRVSREKGDFIRKSREFV